MSGRARSNPSTKRNDSNALGWMLQENNLLAQQRVRNADTQLPATARKPPRSNEFLSDRFKHLFSMGGGPDVGTTYTQARTVLTLVVYLNRRIQCWNVFQVAVYVLKQPVVLTVVKQWCLSITPNQTVEQYKCDCANFWTVWELHTEIRSASPFVMTSKRNSIAINFV